MSTMVFHSHFHTPPKLTCFFFFLLILLSRNYITAADQTQTINIGVIIDEDSRAGKEEKTAIQIAAQKLNSGSVNHKLSIHFKNSTSDPLQAASSAEELIKEKNVQVIIGMDTWEEAALVANIGQKAQIPVISFSAATSVQSSNLRWPFLVQMTNEKVSEEANCIASMVQSYNWKRVIVVYEDNPYGDEYKGLSLLSEALQKVGSEIEHSLALPHVSSNFDPKETIREGIAEILRKQSRVFVVLKSSISMATRLFKEAHQVGLMGRDSVWILGDSFTSLIDSIDSSAFSFMQGALGIKTYYSEKSPEFLEFESSFRRSFRSNYPEEDKFQPGIHAIRAYDSILMVSRAIETIRNVNNTTSNNLSGKLLDRILSGSFPGLTGKILLQKGKLSESPVYRIVNIVGKSYKELGFWSGKSGFLNNLGEGNLGGDRSMKMLNSVVNWPGDVEFRFPKGWAMPTNEKKLKIGVPSSTSFERFVKVTRDENSKETIYTGFCIKVFEEAVKYLEAKRGYTLPYDFVEDSGTYDDLVFQVYNKTYDAVVGDFTILANRSKYVDFTQPYTESGLSMLVPVKSERHVAWKFLRPFTVEMWIATLTILFYTMFVVWFMEHQDNEEFRGPWKDQLGTALWFTFSSLFFAHREKIQSNYSKVVVMMWLFVVFILTAGYTASLTSMLTIRKLEPTVTSIESLRKANAPVGCDPDSFVGKYLRDVLDLKNIISVPTQDEYPKNFDNGSIAAAFLELPYQKVFLNEYCNQYTATGPAYKFGGLGFVFQKGSPITDDVSEAILDLLEQGDIQELEQKWLNTSRSCSDSNPGLESESLSLDSFWGIFLLSGLISTATFTLFLYRNLFRKHVQQRMGGSSNGNRWNRAVRLVSMVLRLNDNRVTPARETLPSREERNPPVWELVSPSEVPPHLEIGRPTQLEIPMNNLDHIRKGFR